MGPFVLRRLLLSIPTFLGITLLTFGVMQLAPGEPFSTDEDVPRAGRAPSRTDGDQPLLIQYARWVRQVATMDFGRSLQDGRPVAERIGEALPQTLLLSSLALLFSYLIAVPLGAVAAARRDTAVDRGISVTLFVLYSLPGFWVALVLLLYLAGDRGVAWFPLQGLTSEGFASFGLVEKVSDLAWHLVLPVTALTLGALAMISRHVRSRMVEVLQQDFVRTARAKGLSERAVVFRHALRNSLLPVVTLFALMLPHVMGGSVLVERIFGIPGMGQLAFEGILHRDYPTVMGVTTWAAIVTLFCSLASDLVYGWIDPRVRPEAKL